MELKFACEQMSRKCYMLLIVLNGIEICLAAEAHGAVGLLIVLNGIEISVSFGCFNWNFLLIVLNGIEI